jgi:hypothetical protein
MIAPYAANLLLCTLLFHPFRTPGWFTPIGGTGWWLGLPVLATCLAQVGYLAFVAIRRPLWLQ